jgi:hypothetical protein
MLTVHLGGRMKSLFVTAALLASAPAFAQTVSTEGECGGPVRITSSGLTPSGSYVILKGNGTGRAVIPGGPCAGVATGLASSGFTFFGPFSADARGNGSLAPSVPGDAAGAYIQILDISTCRLSSATEICPAGGDFVGEYVISNGPEWTGRPATFTCTEACAATFGGAAGDYTCGSSPSVNDRQAHYDTNGVFTCDDYYGDEHRSCAFYDAGCQSAYVRDNCSGYINYCFRR